MSSRWIGGLLLVVLFVALANDGRHHLHEFRDVHSASHYSNVELMRGAFDPGPAPVRAGDEIAIWYANKLLHLAVLRRLIHTFGFGVSALASIQAAYMIMLPIAVLVLVRALRNVGTTVSRATLIGGIVLLSPTTLYLGFKTLGDVPALLLAATAAAAFTEELHRRSRLPWLSGLSGFLVALSALAAWTGPAVFVGLAVALVVVPPPACERRDVLRACAFALLAAAVSFAGCVLLLGGSVHDYANGLIALVGFSKALPTWLFAAFETALFGTALWLLAPLAWLSVDTDERRRFLIWFVVGVLPAGMGLGFFEPRYLLGALVPLAGLSAIGLEVAWIQLERWGWSHLRKCVVAVTVGLLAVCSSTAVQQFMPYESNQHQLVRLVRDHAPSEAVSVLVPWNYSDFHLLRFAFPDKRVYLVQTAATEDGTLVDDPAWTARFNGYYGDHFLPNGDALLRRLPERAVLIGWTILPFVQNLHDFLSAVGLRRIAARLEGFELRNHLRETWLWSDPRFTVHEIASCGQYRVFNLAAAERTFSRTRQSIAFTRVP